METVSVKMTNFMMFTVFECIVATKLNLNLHIFNPSLFFLPNHTPGKHKINKVRHFLDHEDARNKTMFLFLTLFSMLKNGSNDQMETVIETIEN